MSIPAPHSSFDTSSEAQQRRGKRRTGSRAKLAQRFFEDTYAAWEEQGPSILARAAFHDPVAFANMVARLMPQKIEVSTPTDGMSDERLAEMLDMAERMAALRAQGVATPLLPHELNHENGVVLDMAEEGGGGPDRAHLLSGVNSASTLRPGSTEAPVATHNKLDAPDSGLATVDSENATVAEVPYPVGRPFPKADHDVERQNRSGLIEQEDVDPASLF